MGSSGQRLLILLQQDPSICLSICFVLLLYVIVVYLRTRIVEFVQRNFKSNFKLQEDRWINRIVSAVAFTGLNTQQTSNQQVIISNQLLSLGMTDGCYLLLIATG